MEKLICDNCGYQHPPGSIIEINKYSTCKECNITMSKWTQDKEDYFKKYKKDSEVMEKCIKCGNVLLPTMTNNVYDNGWLCSKCLTFNEVIVDNTIRICLDCKELLKKCNCNKNKCKNDASTHYELWKGLEAIDVIKSVLTTDEYRGFLKANILKYQLRLGKKDNIEKEQEKIRDYRRELDNV